MMAHELAHVQNRDTLTMTITATLAGAISMLGNFAFFFGGNRDNNNPLGFIGVLVAMIVAPLAAAIVQMAISRTREYSADRRGAEICGHPLWLASALDKIASSAERIHNPGRRAQSGDGASVHHQPAVGRAHGQSVLDASGHGKPHRGAAGDGRATASNRRASAPQAPHERRAGRPHDGPWARTSRPKTPPRARTAEIESVGPQPDRPEEAGGRERAGRAQALMPGIRRPSGDRRRQRPRPGRAQDGGEAARRRHRREDAARRADRQRARPSASICALDARDRALVRAILTTALRFRVTIEHAARRSGSNDRCRRTRTTLSHILHVARGADPVSRRARQRRRRPRRRPTPSPIRARRASPALVNGVLRVAGARQGCRAAEPALAATLDAPDWFVERLTAAYGADRREAILAAHRVEAPVDFTVKSDAGALGRAARRHRAADRHGARRDARRPRHRTAGLCRGRVVGAGRRRRAAGAAVRRRRGQARRRSLRRARRQDGAAGAGRRPRHGGRHSTQPAEAAAPAISRGCGSRPRSSQADMLDLRSRPSCSTRCCSMRPAPRPARCAAIPTCPGPRSPADIEKLAGAAGDGCSTRAVDAGQAGRPPRLLQLLARPARGRGAGRGVPGATAGLSSLDPIRAGESCRHRRIRHAERLRCAPRLPTCDSARPAISGLDGFFAARLRRLG